MQRWIALFLAVVMVCTMAACGEKDPVTEVETTQESSGDLTEESTQEPEKTLAVYDDPPDHPHEGNDLTIYDGIYRAKLPHDDDEQTWLQIKGYNDFIVLEYHGLMEGQVYRYWAEEFWPGEGWYTEIGKNSVSGKSQIFSSMGQYENYSGLPQNRCITLTDDGVMLNYDDADAEYYEKDDDFFGGHSDAEMLRYFQGEDTILDFDYLYGSEEIVGTWAAWTGWESICMTFAEDGTFSMFYKEAQKPIRVYEGIYGFGEYSGNLEIIAERTAYGQFPQEANWQWQIGEAGFLEISAEENSILPMGDWNFWPVEHDFFTVMDANTALGYIVANFTEYGDYTDRYGTTYSYYYSLPQFYYSDHEDLQKINEQITDHYYPIIEMEQTAMQEGEILSYDCIDWQSAVYNGILFLHVSATTYDWEEHSSFYVDAETMVQLDAKEVLKRLNIGEQEFLDASKTRAEEIFQAKFGGMPEEDKEYFGYYDYLEQTVSDEFVNLDMPIFVDQYGIITVYLKLSHMAGSGIDWEPSAIFEEYYPEISEDAVG